MKKRKDFFWASYTDLMTSLFFVMLVLYIVTFKLLTDQRNKYKAEAKQLENIKKVEKAINSIDTTERYFVYDTTYRKHVLNIDVKFGTGEKNIFDLSGSIRTDLRLAGKKIIDLIERLQQEDVNYLVIIEGQASKDNWEGNNKLSYQRALALYEYWKDRGIKLDEIPNCELIVAGSGERGVPRKQPDIPPANQRFLIHIIPKFGNLDY